MTKVTLFPEAGLPQPEDVFYLVRGGKDRQARVGDLNFGEGAAEAAAAAAQSAAEAAASAEVVLANAGYDDVAAVEGAAVPATAEIVRVNGGLGPGDGLDALYKRSLTDPGTPGVIQSADGAFWVPAVATHFSRTPVLDARAFGVFGSDSPEAAPDVTSELQDAIDAAVGQKRELILPAAYYAITSGIGHVGVGDFRMRSTGGTPRLLAPADLNTLVTLSAGDAVVSGLAFDETPTIGDSIVKLTDTTGLAAGMFLTIGSDREWDYDGRNIWFNGQTSEILRVIDGEYVELNGIVEDEYLVGTDAITITARWPKRVLIDGLHTEIAAAAQEALIGNTHIRCVGAFAELRDITVEGGGGTGIRLTNCRDSVVEKVRAGKLGRGGSIGYATATSSSQNVVFRDLRTYSCRAGFDASAAQGDQGGPSRDITVEDFYCTGGGIEGDGETEYQPNGASLCRGVGTHGPSERVTFRNGTVANAGFGVLIRGKDTLIENVRFVGFIEQACIYGSYGTGLVVRGCTYSPLATTGKGTIDYDKVANEFIRLGNASSASWDYDSPVTVIGNTVDGIRQRFILFRHVDGIVRQFVSKGNRITFARDPGVDPEAYVYAHEGESLEISGGEFVDLATQHVGEPSAQVAQFGPGVTLGVRVNQDSATQIGERRWRLHMEDDSQRRIRIGAGGVAANVSLASDDAAVNSLITILPASAAAGTVNEIGSEVARSATTLGNGTAGTDGKFNVHLTAAGAIMVTNRRGSTINVELSVL